MIYNSLHSLPTERYNKSIHNWLAMSRFSHFLYVTTLFQWNNNWKGHIQRVNCSFFLGTFIPLVQFNCSARFVLVIIHRKRFYSFSSFYFYSFHSFLFSPVTNCGYFDTSCWEKNKIPFLVNLVKIVLRYVGI
jgi:hypothetical protein